VLGERLTHRLCNAEIDDLRGRLIVLQRDEDVRRLEVPVDDAFLMRVLYALADMQKQIESLLRRQTPTVADAVSDSPRTYSIAKYGRPCGVAPASNTFAMAGWFIIASA
jgi:hypothetical protein